MANPIVAGVSGDTHLFAGTVQGQEGVESFDDFTIKAPHGATFVTDYSEVLATGITGATYTFTSAILDGWFVHGVVLYIVTLVTASGGGASFKVGDGTDDDKWGTGIAFTAGTATTSASFTASPSGYYSDTNVVLTVNTGAFTAGDVRLTVFYSKITAMTG